jgi:cysteine desulfurase/selenocysteine lyase
VTSDDYQLSADSPNHIYTKFESGLQAWGEIVALGAAFEWLKTAKPASQIDQFATEIYKFLAARPKVHLTSDTPSSIISFYVDGLDSHLLAQALSDAGIMVRSGYFCCHYYLDHIKHYPPLVRVSLGLHNRPSDVEKLLAKLEKIV